MNNKPPLSVVPPPPPEPPKSTRDRGNGGEQEIMGPENGLPDFHEAGEHPARFYITYLLIKKRREQNDDDRYLAICNSLAEISIAPPDKSYVDRLFMTLRFPHEFDPLDRNHAASHEFLVRHRVEKLFFPTDIVKDAKNILYIRKVRHLVECMTLGDFEPMLTAGEVNKKTQMLISSRIVETFLHYFFNPLIMSEADWVRYLILFRYPWDDVVGSSTPYVTERLSILSGGMVSAIHRLRLDIQVTDGESTLNNLQLANNAAVCELRMTPISAAKISALTRLGKSIRETHSTMTGATHDVQTILGSLKDFLFDRRSHRLSDMNEVENTPKGEIPPLAQKLIDLGAMDKEIETAVDEEEQDPFDDGSNGGDLPRVT